MPATICMATSPNLDLDRIAQDVERPLLQLGTLLLPPGCASHLLYGIILRRCRLDRQRSWTPNS
jgi:hypothetical protein